MTPEQEQWLKDNPEFGPIGPPRPVQFEEWGTLTADAQYERLDNAPRKPIQVGAGQMGVAKVRRNDPCDDWSADGRPLTAAVDTSSDDA